MSEVSWVLAVHPIQHVTSLPTPDRVVMLELGFNFARSSDFQSFDVYGKMSFLYVCSVDPEIWSWPNQTMLAGWTWVTGWRCTSSRLGALGRVKWQGHCYLRSIDGEPGLLRAEVTYPRSHSW